MPAILPPTLAAIAVTKDSTSGEIILYQTVGFIIVILSLALLAVVISFIGKLFIRKTPATAAAKPVVTTKTSPAKVVADDKIPAHIIAVIAAAVAVEIGQRHQIVAVTRVGSNWSMEGRRSIYSSHTLRRR